eukprot:SM000008S22336  [mRNA]  locus=s8:1149406:1151199:+ [translate_table: standard]
MYCPSPRIPRDAITVAPLTFVGVQPGGSPRALVDVVVTEAYKSSASTHIAGHAVGGAEQRKLRHYSVYPRSDLLLPTAIDTVGCLGPRFHTLLENIASLGYARRKDMLPAQMGMPAVYLSFFQRRVSACLQRAQAHALHQKAGRALAGRSRACRLPSGIRASVSDLYVAGRPAATPAACAEIRRKRATAERQLGAPPAARREQVRAAVVDEKRSKATAPTPTACDWLTERRRPGQGGRARSGAAAGGGWTGIQLHRRFLNSSKEHCSSPRRLDRPSVAPPIPELKQRALPLSQVLLHALCRQFASFAGVPRVEEMTPS